MKLLSYLRKKCSWLPYTPEVFMCDIWCMRKDFWFFFYNRKPVWKKILFSSVLCFIQAENWVVLYCNFATTLFLPSTILRDCSSKYKIDFRKQSRLTDKQQRLKASNVLLLHTNTRTSFEGYCLLPYYYVYCCIFFFIKVWGAQHDLVEKKGLLYSSTAF